MSIGCRALAWMCLLLASTVGCARETTPGVPVAPAPRLDARPDGRAEGPADRAAPADVGVDVEVAPPPLDAGGEPAGPADASAAPLDTPAAPDVTGIDTAPLDAGNPIAQTPPRERRLLDPWLAAGHYKSWRCEPAVMNPRPGSPHGRNRVCSNDLVSRHGSGPYPVGAASVKEIYYGNRIGVFAVAVKVTAGNTGNNWYWYEQNDLEGVGAAGCTGCHSRAERAGGNDFVYIQVK